MTDGADFFFRIAVANVVLWVLIETVRLTADIRRAFAARRQARRSGRETDR